MKNLSKKISVIVLSSVLLVAGSVASFANAKQISSEDSLIKVCEAMQSNNKLRLHQAVKRTGYSYKSLAKGLMCNGQTMYDFAISSGATDTAVTLARKSALALPELVAQSKLVID